MAVGEDSRIKRRCFVATAVDCVRSQHHLPSSYQPSESDPASHGGAHEPARAVGAPPHTYVFRHLAQPPPSNPPCEGGQGCRRSLLTIVAGQTNMTGIKISQDLLLSFLPTLFLSALAVVLHPL